MKTQNQQHYWIAADAISITPNAANNNPDYVLVQLYGGTVIRVNWPDAADTLEKDYPDMNASLRSGLAEDVRTMLGYAADGVSDRTWRLSAYSTKLQNSTAEYGIYARLGTDGNALLVFSSEDEKTVEYDEYEVEGNAGSKAVAVKYVWMKLGTLTAPNVIDGVPQPTREVMLDTGNRGTTRGTYEAYGLSEWYSTNSSTNRVDFKDGWKWGRFLADSVEAIKLRLRGRHYRTNDENDEDEWYDETGVLVSTDANTIDDDSKSSDKDSTLVTSGWIFGPLLSWLRGKFVRKDNADGTEEMQGSLSVGEDLDAGSLSVTGDASVGGNASVDGHIEVAPDSTEDTVAATFGNTTDSLLDGKGALITKDGRGQFETMQVRGTMTVLDMVASQIHSLDGYYFFSDTMKILRVETIEEDVRYKLFFDQQYDTENMKFYVGDILLSIKADLSSSAESPSITPAGNVAPHDVVVRSWMRVEDTSATHSDNADGMWAIVSLYSGISGNAAPQGGTYVARRGNDIVPTNPADSDFYDKRRSSWCISVEEGRIAYYTGQNTPVVKDNNYAVAVGRLPDIKPVRDLALVGEVGIYTKYLLAEHIYSVDWQGDTAFIVKDMGRWDEEMANRDEYFCSSEYSEAYGKTVVTTCQVTDSINGVDCVFQVTAPVDGDRRVAKDRPMVGSSEWNLISGGSVVIRTQTLYATTTTSTIDGDGLDMTLDDDLEWTEDTSELDWSAYRPYMWRKVVSYTLLDSEGYISEGPDIIGVFGETGVVVNAVLDSDASYINVGNDRILQSEHPVEMSAKAEFYDGNHALMHISKVEYLGEGIEHLQVSVPDDAEFNADDPRLSVTVTCAASDGLDFTDGLDIPLTFRLTGRSLVADKADEIFTRIVTWHIVGNPDGEEGDQGDAAIYASLSPDASYINVGSDKILQLPVGTDEMLVSTRVQLFEGENVMKINSLRLKSGIPAHVTLSDSISSNREYATLRVRLTDGLSFVSLRSIDFEYDITGTSSNGNIVTRNAVWHIVGNPDGEDGEPSIDIKPDISVVHIPVQNGVTLKSATLVSIDAYKGGNKIEDHPFFQTVDSFDIQYIGQNAGWLGVFPSVGTFRAVIFSNGNDRCAISDAAIVTLHTRFGDTYPDIKVMVYPNVAGDEGKPSVSITIDPSIVMVPVESDGDGGFSVSSAQPVTLSLQTIIGSSIVSDGAVFGSDNAYNISYVGAIGWLSCLTEDGGKKARVGFVQGVSVGRSDYAVITFHATYGSEQFDISVMAYPNVSGKVGVDGDSFLRVETEYVASSMQTSPRPNYKGSSSIPSDYGAAKPYLYRRDTIVTISGKDGMEHSVIGDWMLFSRFGADGQPGVGSPGYPGCIVRPFIDKLVVGNTYCCDVDTAEEDLTYSVRYQDILAIRLPAESSVQSGFIVFRVKKTFILAADAINLEGYSTGDEIDLSQYSVDQIRRMLVGSNGNYGDLIISDDGAPVFEEVDANFATAFFNFLIARSANISMLTGSCFTITDNDGDVLAGMGNMVERIYDLNDGDGTVSSESDEYRQQLDDDNVNLDSYVENQYYIWAGGKNKFNAPFYVMADGSFYAMNGVFGGLVRNNVLVITAYNIRKYVHWGLTEELKWNDSERKWERKEGWILDIEKTGPNVIFFSSANGSGADPTYVGGYGKINGPDGLNGAESIHIHLPWASEVHNPSANEADAMLAWLNYATTYLGYDPSEAYRAYNIARQYVGQHAMFTNATVGEDISLVIHGIKTGGDPYVPYVVVNGFDEGDNEIILECDAVENTKIEYDNVISSIGIEWKSKFFGKSMPSANSGCVAGLIPSLS